MDSHPAGHPSMPLRPLRQINLPLPEVAAPSARPILVCGDFHGREKKARFDTGAAGRASEASDRRLRQAVGRALPDLGNQFGAIEGRLWRK